MLGKNLVPLLKNSFEVIAPSHKELDILDFEPSCPCHIVVNSVAYTDVTQAEKDRMNCFKTNVEGTLNLLVQYPNVPFVYISSEYAYKPVNFYSVTKMLAEQLVMSHSAPYLIIRTLFKPRPWPYEKAFMDKFTLGDYVDVIAEKIDKEIMNWDRKSSKLIYIGTGRKTYYDLALETKPDIIGNSINDI